MMKDDRRDASLLIGLHKLAEHSGDGLVPELYALIAAREEAEANNIITFRSALKPGASTVPAAEAGKVLMFRK